MQSKQSSRHWRVVLVFLIIAIVGGGFVYYVLTRESNKGLVSGIVGSCQEIPITKSSRMAIIRVDDIQSYFLEDLSIKMMEDAKARGIPLSLGLIPKSMEESTPIYQYLKKNLCWLEIAQHGWDHAGVTPDTPEFAGIDMATAAADIERGMVVLEKLTEDPIVTFIPPLNIVSDDARKALAAAGIKIVSSEGSALFDYDATTFNFMTDTLNSPETVLRDCALHVANTTFCVIMVHPLDFATNNELDPAKYAAYLDILDNLKAANYTFVRFKDLVDLQ